MNQILLGAIALGSWVAAVFFLRFWRDTRDRFFLFFSIAFVFEGVSRVVQGLANLSSEEEPFFYLVRLISYACILLAVADKNRKKPPQAGAKSHTQPPTK